ncbi:MAG: hypothetical protein M1826_000571 [Phylliscum demangeonii]|nr:MAG: hypothetical protein M1826_000571 [Phylliscum demangeonii]
MRAPAFLLLMLSCLLVVEVWAAPAPHRLPTERSSTAPRTEVGRRPKLARRLVAIGGGLTYLKSLFDKWRSGRQAPHGTLSSLGRLGPAHVEVDFEWDHALLDLARPDPATLERAIAFELRGYFAKTAVVQRMVSDEKFLQCMLRRLNIPMPRSHRELAVPQLDLFRSAYLCQIETGDFGFKFPHVQDYVGDLADEPVGYRKEDLAKAAESLRFQLPAPLSRVSSGLQKNLRALERPVGRAVLSMERAAPKRMRMPTAAESWRFASEHP